MVYVEETLIQLISQKINNLLWEHPIWKNVKMYAIPIWLAKALILTLILMGVNFLPMLTIWPEVMVFMQQKVAMLKVPRNTDKRKVFVA